MRRMIVGLITGLALATSSRAAETGSEAAVRAALGRHDLYTAAQALDALVEARLPDREPGRPDPVLDRLYADLLTAQGQTSLAGIVLPRVAREAAGPDADHYRLLYGAYLEDRGDAKAAAEIYTHLATGAGAPAVRDGAVFGLARLRMGADPAGALQALHGLGLTAVAPADAWEFALLKARAEALAGDSRAASDDLARAWDAAPAAALGAAATARVSQDRALSAARNGDRTAFVALLSVDRFNRQANEGQEALAANAPLCSRDIRPEDMVVVEAQHLASPGRPTTSLVWANRPGVADAFLLGVRAAGRNLRVPDGQSSMFALRCRQAPAANYVVGLGVDEPLGEWLTARGAYPLSGTDETDQGAALSAELARREKRYGPNSVMLTPVLTRLLVLGGAQAFGDKEAAKPALDLSRRIEAILAADGAPPHLRSLQSIVSLSLAVASQQTSADQGLVQVQSLLLQLADDPNTPADVVYTLLAGAGRTPNASSAFRIALLGAGEKVLAARTGPRDPRTVAIALQLHDALAATGREAEAAAAVEGRGVPADACALASAPMHIVSSNITAEDYPGDLTFSALRGRTLVEASVDAHGAMNGGRLIAADPPYAFNAITLSRLPTFRYDPPRFGTATRACVGQVQSVSWQLPQ